ncbi:hypothetical protein G9A89_008463 [Geosiphon pyriformis]|nr:hypothetical protein G9A89_008463 [Geosiphon pyriformis]
MEARSLDIAEFRMRIDEKNLKVVAENLTKILIDSKDPILKKLAEYAYYANLTYKMYGKAGKIAPGALVPEAFVEKSLFQPYLECKDKFFSLVQKSLSKNPEIEQIGIIGHSLGGALAIFAALDLKKFRTESTFLKGRQIDIEVVTFGAPRIGDRIFAHYV